MADIETRVGSLETRVTSLEQQVSNMTTKLDMFIDEINSEGLSSEEISGKINEMKDILNTINPDYINVLNEKL